MRFIQFLMPDGRSRCDESIERDPDIEAKASDLIRAGFSFEIEMLSNGTVSMDCTDRSGDVMLAGRACENGPAVPEAIDEMVNEAYQLWVEEGKQHANQIDAS